MLTEERHHLIINELDKERIVPVHHLVSLLDVSESTIRRDLSMLEEAGYLVRVHGGAKRNTAIDKELNIQEKASKNSQEKLALGKYAASLVEPGDVIFVDAGTTTLQMIPYLQANNITVVTNGIPQTRLLAEHAIPTIIVGGKLKLATQAIIGVTAQQQLRQYRFSKVFLGMNGVDLNMGYTTPDEEEAAIKRVVIEFSNQSFVLADHSKFSKVSFCKVADIEDAAIITTKLDAPHQKWYEKATQIYTVS